MQALRESDGMRVSTLPASSNFPERFTKASTPSAVRTGARSPENYPAQEKSGLLIYLPSLSMKPNRFPSLTPARP